MKWDKQYKLDYIWLYALGFFAARAEVLETYPFSIAIFVAAHLTGYGSIAVYLAIVLGLFSTFSLVTTIKYGIMLILITIAFRLLEAGRGDTNICRNRLTYALLAGSVNFLYGISYQAIWLHKIDWVNGGIEAVMITSFSVVLQSAILVVKERRSMRESENIISTLVLLGIVLWGMPLQLAGWFTILQGAVYYCILFLSYKYGIAYGTSVGTICGIVLAVRMHQVEWIAICVILSLAASFLGEWNRWLAMIGFMVLAGFLGAIYYSQLLEVQALRGLLSAGVLYILTPKSLLLKNMDREKGNECDAIGLSLQHSLQQRLKEYALAFQRLGENYIVPQPVYEATSATNAMNSTTNTMNSTTNTMSSGINTSMRPAAISATTSAFATQLVEIGNSLQEFSDGVSTVLPIDVKCQNALIHEFEREHVRVKDIVLVKGMYGRKEIYLSARTIRGRVMTSKEAAEIISRSLGTQYRVSTSSRMLIKHDYDVVVFEEDTQYRYLTGARRSAKGGQRISGDNFSQMELQNGQVLMAIADGMGSGLAACEQSEQIVNHLEELLEAGVKKETAIQLLNELIAVKYQGEDFATLDLCVVDLYTGVGEFLKMGASATFIKRGSWIETIQSTSLPVGIKQQSDIDSIQKKFYHGDMIIMISDGLLDGIVFENKEECLKELLLEIESNNPQEIADALLERVTRMNTHGLQDDACVLVLGIWKKS